MQNMLEAAYNLIIDTKNLFDTFDDVRIEMQAAQSPSTTELTPAFGDIDADIDDDNEPSTADDSQQIYENASSESTVTTGSVLTHSFYPSQITTFQVPASTTDKMGGNDSHDGAADD